MVIIIIKPVETAERSFVGILSSGDNIFKKVLLEVNLHSVGIFLYSGVFYTVFELLSKYLCVLIVFHTKSEANFFSYYI